MKKIKLIYICVLITLGSFTACTSLLDTNPYNQISTGSMWTTENLTDQGVAGIYAALRNWGPYNGGFTGTFGFESWGISGQHQYSEAILSGSVNTEYSFFRDTWKKLYEGVHRANDAIVNIPAKAPITADKKAKLIAEAKFLRAFFYYRLNELYRGVPYYDVPVTVEECIKTQETEEKIWEYVIKDLTDCINETNFPNNDFITGRATRGAAYALRGKAYMQQGEYQKASADFEKVGACGYSLFQEGYQELFYEKNERCPEMIFSVQNTGDIGYGSLSQKYCGVRSAHSTVGTNSWGDYQVSMDVVDLYENADGTPFNWNDIIPGYTTMPIKDREVYFLRDTLNADGTEISSKISQLVRNRLKGMGAVASNYLPNGNEARIIKAYDNRDPRLGMNVITPYYGVFKGYDGSSNPAEVSLVMRWPTFGNNIHIATNPAGAINDLSVNSSQYLYYYHRKFVYEGVNPVHRENCPTDEPLIRYADVLLMWAEALVGQNLLDDVTGAASKLNMVRQRNSVNMPKVVYSDATDLLEKIRNERRIEFVNEGVNLFDEMRWRTWKDTKFKGGVGSSQQVWGAVGNSGTYRWPATNNLYVWPVPLVETQKNQNLVETPGWNY